MPNRKSCGAEILRVCSPPTMCNMSCVMFQVSHVMCQVSGVTGQVSCVNFFLQSDGASRGMVCYQRGPPRLVKGLIRKPNEWWVSEDWLSSPVQSEASSSVLVWLGWTANLGFRVDFVSAQNIWAVSMVNLIHFIVRTWCSRCCFINSLVAE